MANYVNNKQFLAAITEYRILYFECEDAGLEKPKIPNYIGECIYHIANNLIKKGNFSGYTHDWRLEMIGDGIENCMLYLHKFDPAKSSNPFAYFTRIIWFAFIRRIQKEKKQQYIEAKLSMQASLFDGLYSAEDNEITSKRVESLKHMFEPTKVKAEKAIGVELFVEKEEDE